MKGETLKTVEKKNHSNEELDYIAERGRYKTIGIIVILLGIVSFAFFTHGTQMSQVSTFGLGSLGSISITVPDLVVPSFVSIALLSILCILIGIYQLVKGFRKRSNLMLGISILLFITAFLIWATRDKSTNLTGMLRLSAVQAIPLVLGALSGILSERSGIVNIAIEGLMLVSALVSVIVSSVTNNIYLGLISALLASGVLALVHGYLSIHFKVDQIISGMVINIFAAGITGFISIKFLVENPNLNQTALFPNYAILGLSTIPILGPIFFNQNIFFYATIVLIFVIHFALYYTPWGLRTRMVGEHPKAADTLGINVQRTRYTAVFLGGTLAGIAGAYLTLGAVGRFNRLMTSGRGYIALAAMIFGNWNPFGALGASLIFGFASSLESKLSILQVPIPSQILLMAPYIATMIILVGVIGKVTSPAADGQPYGGEE